MTRTFTIEEEGFPDLPQMMLCTVEALKKIGEYDNDPIGGVSIKRGEKYWHGPKWTDISRNMTFQPPNVSRNKAATTHDLKECPLVMRVLDEIGLKDFGPLIVSEKHGMPYWEREIARDWREIARLAGVPDGVWSMDTRAGAISETEAAVGIEGVRKIAGHSSAKTTQGYVRNDEVDAVRDIAIARKNFREAK